VPTAKGIQRRSNIEWECSRVEQVEEVQYLGTIISENGKIDTDIKNRVKRSKLCLIPNKLNKTGKEEINNNTAMRTDRTVYLPTLLYGS
jgi:hypothetical protein